MVKRLLCVLFVLVVAVALAGADGGKLRISARAEVLVPPDVAQVIFSVSGEDPDKAAAEQKAAAEVKAVLDEIAALQLPKLQTRTPSTQTRQWQRPAGGDFGTGGGIGGTGGGRGGGNVGGGMGGRPGPAAPAKPAPPEYSTATVIEVWFEGDAATLEAGLNKIATIASAHHAWNLQPEISTRNLEAAQQQVLAEATSLAVKRARVMARAAGVKLTGFSYIGPMPENARTWTEATSISPGRAALAGGYGSGSSRGGYGGGGYGGGGGGYGGGDPIVSGAPAIEVHGTTIYATIWVTATY